MTEYTTDTFSDPIRNMSDGVLLRIKAIRAGELDSMRHGDAYFSTITEREGEKYTHAVSSHEFTRAFMLDNLSDATVEQDVLSPPVNGLLSGMMLALADAHDMEQSRGASPLAFDTQYAERVVGDAWLMLSKERAEHEDFRLYTLNMGSIAFMSILFSYNPDTNAWQLGYERQSSKVALISDPRLGDIEIVDETDDAIDIS